MPTRPTNPARPMSPDGRANGIRYGNLYAPAPSANELAELRRQQADFGRTVRQIDIQNSWMAVPSLAPIAAVFGVEAAAAAAARFAPKAIPRGPLVLTKRDPYPRGGDNWATRAGRRAHNHYKEMARAKEGWEIEPRLRGPNGELLIPDLGAPPRASAARPRYVEVKPDTPSGRQKAARQTKKYREVGDNKVGTLFYDPKRFIR